MDRDCLTNNILNIQCKHGTLGATLSTHLSVGSKKIVCLDRFNVATGNLLDILRCYKPFETPVTYAHKFCFDRTDMEESPLTPARVDMIIDTNVLIYNGTGSGEDMAIFFESQIKAGGLTKNYLTERVGGCLYVYSYDATASFADTTTVTSDVPEVTIKATNLHNDLDQILNLWNSITEQELCNLITFATNAADTGKTLSGSSGNGGCNC